MGYIVLSDEQVRVIVTAQNPVQVRDGKGKVLGFIPPIWTDADIADAKRRLASNEPRYTTRQVLEHLHSLES